MIKHIIQISRLNKQLLMLLFDALALVLAIIGAFSLRLGLWYVPEGEMLLLVFGAPLLALPIFVRFGLYQSIIRYINFKALWSVMQAVSLYALLWGVVTFMSAIEGIPRSAILINWFLSLLLIGGARLAANWMLGDMRDNQGRKVIIYGAGAAGRQLLTALEASSEYNPIAFIDDDKALVKHFIGGIQVMNRNQLGVLIEKKQASEVLLAMPSINNTKRRDIVDFLQNYSVMVRTLPGVSAIVSGKIKINDLQKIEIQDLLGRDVAAANQTLLGKNINHKVVMVTGAGGSIGSELCRQIVLLKPKALILYELSELALYQINKELSNSNITIYPLLGSVNNSNRLSQTLRRFGVHTIYHAAAYKHVPIVEFNNTEGVNNNVFGTLSCAQAAIQANVETFVLISTDKAVRPTNTMGATKRCAELILQALSQKRTKQNQTKFSIVRFGNVLGSSGSVIPLFTEQIKQGGPITVTDESIIRYFMTISEAVELVIQAGAMGKGGDVFVLDMGEPVRITDLAKKMIRLSGLELKDETNVNGDIAIEYIGLRPGEKLFEELLISENVSNTDNPLIMRAEEDSLSWTQLSPILTALEKAIIDCDQKASHQLLIQAVPDFKPQYEAADLPLK